MSNVAIRRAFEVAIKAVDPTMPTSFENASFAPPADGSKYQAVFLLRARPENPTMDTFRQENGVVQISLFYPLDEGTANAETRAEQILAAFPKGRSLVNAGVTVTINGSAYIMTGRNDGEMWMIPVRIPYFSNIG